MDNVKFPRYRTIKSCLVALRHIDSETAISEWFIRQLCKNNKIEYHASGNKSLVNLDSLLNFLGYKDNQTNTPNYFYL